MLDDADPDVPMTANQLKFIFAAQEYALENIRKSSYSDEALRIIVQTDSGKSMVLSFYSRNVSLFIKLEMEDGSLYPDGANELVEYSSEMFGYAAEQHDVAWFKNIFNLFEAEIKKYSRFAEPDLQKIIKLFGWEPEGP